MAEFSLCKSEFMGMKASASPALQLFLLRMDYNTLRLQQVMHASPYLVACQLMLGLQQSISAASLQLIPVCELVNGQPPFKTELKDEQQLDSSHEHEEW